ncbi:hypothetical protein CSC67_11460 [Pusillimonas caeni]|nr:hypothetical protein CSC67_11460 [Pusillimonas caeni]
MLCRRSAGWRFKAAADKQQVTCPGLSHTPASERGQGFCYAITNRYGGAVSIPVFLTPLEQAVCPPNFQGAIMRSILLWLLGVPIPIIILLALFWH